MGTSAKSRSLRKTGAAPARPAAARPIAAAVGAIATPIAPSARDIARRNGCPDCELVDYELALEEKNARLEQWRQFVDSVLGSMSEVLIACDRDGAIEKVNPALERLTGQSEEVLRGTPLWDLLADEASRERAGHFARELHLGSVEDCEIGFRAADGSAQPVAVNCAPRLSPAGQFIGMVVTGRPVGELRRAYRALQSTHDALKRAQAQLLQAEKMASLGRLVAGVAHELNNPISFVLGNTHALARYGERLARYLEAVHGERSPESRQQLREGLKIDAVLADLPQLIAGTVEGAARTRDIVAGLRRFAAAGRGASKPFALRPVLDKAIHWVTRASGSTIRVSVDAPEDCVVAGVADEIQQVFMNLVRNAIDATEGRPDPRLAIGVQATADCATVVFTDNGPGFRADEIERVFEPFFTTKPVGKGTGLGLSISYGIVERHGGTIAAGNCAAGGAQVTVRLPRPPGGR